MIREELLSYASAYAILLGHIVPRRWRVGAAHQHAVRSSKL